MEQYIMGTLCNRDDADGIRHHNAIQSAFHLRDDDQDTILCPNGVPFLESLLHLGLREVKAWKR